MGRYASEVQLGIKRALDAGVSQEKIDSLEGYTGAVGIWKTDRPGPVTALRFDIDALYLSETQDPQHLPNQCGFASQYTGVMHACGHDCHAGVGLAIAHWIADHADQLCGTIKLLFQPAEEGTRGAMAMAQSGIVDDVDKFFASHIGCAPRLGFVTVTSPGYNATIKFDVSFEGKPAHSVANPQNGRNALMAACHTAVMIGNDGTCDIRGAKRAGLSAVYLHTNLSPVETVAEADAVIEGADMAQLEKLSETAKKAEADYASAKFLLDQGIDGFWNDMNEPAIFYSEKRLEKVFDELETFRGKNQDLMTHFHFKDLVLGLANNPEDYRSFYHNFNGEGTLIRHDKVHNLYGYNMTRAAGEAFEELEPDKRILMFSRSSYIGMHRYGGIWQGDNLSWWSHLLLNIKMMPSLNMCGFLYTGADLGGFGADTTEDLVLRWMQFGLFTPLMRNHAALGTRKQELYQFSNSEACGNMVKIRYSLLPYLYSEYMKAALRDEMMFRPLAFDYTKDPFADQVEDQLMIGDSIMAAPVHEQNATGRYVYLPEDMMLVTMRSPEDYEVRPMEKGHHYVPAAMEELIFFIRKNHVIPVAKAARNVEDMDFEHLDLLGYVTEEAVYELYDDDGNSKDYENPEHYETITVTSQGTISQSGKMKKVFGKFSGIQ